MVLQRPAKASRVKPLGIRIPPSRPTKKGNKMPTFRTMTTEKFEDSIFYRSACACGNNEHDVVIEIEHDKKFNLVLLNFYKTIAWCSHWGDMNFFQRCWLKIKAITKILFTGYIELNETFLINNKQQIEEFLEAIKEGIQYVNKEK